MYNFKLNYKYLVKLTINFYNFEKINNNFRFRDRKKFSSNRTQYTLANIENSHWKIIFFSFKTR